MQDIELVCGLVWLAVAVLTGWIARSKGLSFLLYCLFGIMAGGALYTLFGAIGGVVGGFFALLFTVFQPRVA